MRLVNVKCKCKNIHISKVINTFHMRKSFHQMMLDECVVRVPLRYASLASLFTGAKEAKFPYFNKGKVSSWLISISSDIISDWHFVLFSLHSSLIMQYINVFQVFFPFHLRISFLTDL